MSPSYYCTVVNGQKGCCRNGKICTSGGGGGGECETTGYVRCPGENFCCRTYHYPHFFPTTTSSTHAPFPILAPDYTCYRDSSNTPRCSLYTSYTLTRTTYSTNSPTSTSTSPRSTSTSDGNDDDSDPPDLPDSDDNSDSNGNNSTSSSSTLRSTPTGTASGATSGAKDWKASVTFFGLAPLLLLVGVCVL